MKLSEYQWSSHSLTLVKGHSDFKVKCLTFGLYTQVSNSGPLGPLVLSFPPKFLIATVIFDSVCLFRIMMVEGDMRIIIKELISAFCYIVQQ